MLCLLPVEPDFPVVSCPAQGGGHAMPAVSLFLCDGGLFSRR